MLVITRRIGEVLCIGDDIRIKITDVSGCAVRLGISAPREIPVDRLEIRERKDLEKANALPK